MDVYETWFPELGEDRSAPGNGTEYAAHDFREAAEKDSEERMPEARTKERSQLDGKPYYCKECGLNYHEWRIRKFVCGGTCEIESEKDANERNGTISSDSQNLQ